MRTAVVTGSASGLGAAIRARLEADGVQVIGVDLHDQEVVADLSTIEGRNALVHEVERRSGASVDVVVAGAGVGPTAPVQLIASVNYFGAVATLDGLFPLLSRGSSPAAVAIASNSMGLLGSSDLVEACVAGNEGRAREIAAKMDGSTVYANSKLALARAVRLRADSWGPAGVRLNAIAPGPVETPLLQATRDDPELGAYVDALPIPLGRSAVPAEIAELVAFLLGESAAIVHGSVLFADGGTDAMHRPDHA